VFYPSNKGRTLKNRLAKASIAATLTFGLILSVSGCSPKPAAEARVLHYGNLAEPGTLDPAKANLSPEGFIMREMFVGLTTEDASSKPIPGMATNWTTSPDGKVWTFKLRDAVWSDGVPITADDFVFSFRRTLDPKIAAPYASLLYPIKNAEAYSSGTAPGSALGIAAPDPKTLVITLENPAPYLPDLLRHWLAYPVPRHVVEKYGDAWIKPENVVSNGPFLLKEWRSNDFVRVEKNPRYWDAVSVCLNTVIFYPTNDPVTAERMMRTGALDVQRGYAGQRTAYLRKEMPAYMRPETLAGLDYIAFNTRKPPLADTRVRQALSLGIDRTFIAEKILAAGEMPAETIVPIAISGYPGGPIKGLLDAPLPERLVKARALLEEAGFGPAKPLVLTFSYANVGDRARLAPVLQSEWRAIAPWVSVEIIGNEQAVHFANLRSGAFEIASANWSADYNDAKNFLYLLESRTGGMNYTGYANPAFDRLMRQSDQTADAPARAALMRQAEEIALRDAAMAPVHYMVAKNLVSPRVTGWVENGFGIHRPVYLCTKEALAEKKGG
jgi:oligopeptide transport system substrate-binding protein